MTSGDENGRSDATTASVESGSPVALSTMMNEAMIKIVSGVIVVWGSSCRETMEPATANSPA